MSLQTRNIQDIYPLSPLQEGMLFHKVLDPDSNAYFLQTSYRVKGALDIPIVAKSLEKLSERHEILRTAFLYKDLERPLQVLLNDRTIGFLYRDLRVSGNSEEEIAALVLNEKEMDRKRSFDLSRDVLMRVTLLQLGEDEYEFIWSYHHILMDGWCLGILTKEFYEIYNSVKAGRTVSLPKVRPYKDFIQWLAKQDRVAARNYWENYLKGYEQLNGVPAPQRSSGDLRYQQKKIRFEIGTRVTEFLSGIALKNHVTLNSVICALWGIILSKYNDTDDIVFGTIVSGRPQDLVGADNMVGLFINTVPVRIRYGDDTRFSDLLVGLREDALESSSYQHYPLADIQSLSYLKKGLLNHLLIYENYPGSAAEIAGFDNRNEEAGSGAGQKTAVVENGTFEQTSYDFNIIIAPGTNIAVILDFNELTYPPSFVSRIQGHFQKIFEQLLFGEDPVVKEMSVVSDWERTFLLSKYNDSAVAYQKEKTVVCLFEEQVLLNPEKTAVEFNAKSISYRKLNCAANQLAALLIEKYSIAAGSRVALLLDRSPEMIIAIIAVLKTGACYIPIDAAFPVERIEFLARDCRCSLVLIDNSTKGLISGISGVNTLEISSNWDKPGFSRHNNPGIATDSREPAYILYTSGTTGMPKGVVVAHYSLTNFLQSLSGSPGIKNNQSLLAISHYTFDVSIGEIFLPLVNGAKVILASGKQLENITELVELIHTKSPSVISGTPSFLRLLLDAGWKGDPFVSIFSIGEPLNAELVTALLARTCKVWNFYGPTETTIYSSVHLIASVEETHLAGRPIANTLIYILSRERQLLPIGVPGRIYIGGDGVATGYLDPELTKRKFFDNPFLSEAGQRIYDTGDLGYLTDEGRLCIIGRADRQIKQNGVRIELGEIESVMLSFPGIKSATVQFNQYPAGKLIVGFFIGKENVQPVEFKSFLRRFLPENMIPTVLLQVPSFPLTPSGKIDAKNLPQPVFGSQLPDNNHAFPLTEIQKQIAAIWETVLQVSGIRITDNFFDIGGHSLRAIRVISLIHKHFSRQLTIKQLFQNPTIKELELLLTKAPRNEYEQIPETSKNELYELSYAQREIWLAHQINESRRSSYNIFETIVLEDELDKQKFSSALTLVIQKHEILRTVFVEHNGRPMQRILSTEAATFEADVMDVGFEREPQEAAVKLCNSLAMLPFELAKAPLIRVRIVKISQAKSILLIVLHHIIADEQSMNILFSEVQRNYSALMANESIVNPALRINYKDFAAWHNAKLTGTERSVLEAYWVNRLGRGIPAERLSIYNDEITGDDNNLVSFILDSETCAAIANLTRREKITDFSVMASVLSLLLCSYQTEQKIILGAVVSNRVHQDLLEQIGLYVHVVPMMFEIQKSDSFIDLLSRSAAEIAEDLDHQLYPLGMIVESLNSVCNTSIRSLFNVMIDMTGFDQSGKISAEGHSGIEAENIVAGGVSRLSKFDLIFYCSRIDRGVEISLEFNSSHYRYSDIFNLGQQFKTLLKNALQSPKQSVYSLSALEKPKLSFIKRVIKR